MTVPGDGPNVPRLGRLIPVPDAPVKPILSLAGFTRHGPAPIPSVLDAGNVVHVTTGRVAIALALEIMGLEPGQKILVPAYHCASMIMPLSWVRAEPAFYRVREDMSVDLDDVAAKIDGSAKALMVTHYFGFPQDMLRIRRFCDDHGLKLVEDCAHSFFGRVDGRPVGAYGDFAIGSPRKFFPAFDGGCLVSRNCDLKAIRTREQGLGANLKAALTLCQDAIGFGRLPALRPAVDGLKSLRDRLRGAAIEADDPTTDATGNPAQNNSGDFAEFDAEWIDKKPMAVSRFVMRHVSKERVITGRRRNYAILLDGLTDLPGCRPLLPELPEDVVPYMFPIWVDRLDRVFSRLEDDAVPMHRFGQFLAPGIDEAVCEVSSRLSRHALQLPCHQDLTREELGSIIDRVRRAVHHRSHIVSTPESVEPDTAVVT